MTLTADTKKAPTERKKLELTALWVRPGEGCTVDAKDLFLRLNERYGFHPYHRAMTYMSSRTNAERADHIAATGPDFLTSDGAMVSRLLLTRDQLDDPQLELDISPARNGDYVIHGHAEADTVGAMEWYNEVKPFLDSVGWVITLESFSMLDFAAKFHLHPELDSDT